MTGLTAVLAGATGLVGGECLRQLLASPRYKQVVVVTRRKLDPGLRHDKLLRNSASAKSTTNTRCGSRSSRSGTVHGTSRW